MRTTLNIDRNLIDRIKATTGINNKTLIIETALREYLALLQRKNIKSAFGKLKINLDVKEFRRREMDE